METIKVTFDYPEAGKKEKKQKTLDMTQTELVALLICDTLHSEGKYYELESKIFEDVSKGGQVFIKLKNAVI